MAEAPYVCSLSKESLKRAKKEVNEVEKERLGAVETFRTWILQQPHIKCSTETRFLLRFLRFSHFSQLESRKVLEKYFRSKLAEPDWMSNLDTHDRSIHALLDAGYLIPLPGVNDEGRKMLWMRSTALDCDSKVYTATTIVRMFFMVTLYFLEDENVQLNGFEFFTDLTAITRRHTTYLGLDNLKRLIKIWQGAVPARQKAYHLFNPGAIFESLFVLVKPLMPKKLLDRMVMYGNNLESVYKRIPMRMIPAEYLPDDYTGPMAGSVTQIMDKFKAEIMRPEVRARILEETKPEWGLDISKKPDDVPQQSFRKLNID